MDLSKCSPGQDAPESINVIIEVSANSAPVKYELDKETGLMVVDRILFTPMFYPCNYGFVPNTLCGDGDPLDVLVVSEYPLMPKSMITCRPIGLINMEDDGGLDEKILAVPVDKVSLVYQKVQSYKDLPKIQIDQIRHFFEHYKDLEPGKWVKLAGTQGVAEAKSLIERSIANYKG